MKPEKQLYQWDVNQYLTGINPAAKYVDYTIGNEVIRLETDGTRCRIPDEVLQTYGGKTCYERYPDGTFRAYSFNVLYAPKPPDYVFTPEERTTFEALTARVDAAIEEIKRRADSGEFTPKKGVDYFTDAEKAEMMENVSDGAIGEFRKVVDSATTEYNANAAEKLTTYDTNAEQHTTDYNRNAAEKLEAYNSNHTEKVAEYNANAETKTAEFDANAAALQTEVDRLRGECDTLAAENRKQENRIDALMKLNKGQTYDILPEEGEAARRTAPSGAKYVSVDKVGGKSVVWNQLVRNGNFENSSFWTLEDESKGNFTVSNGELTYTQTTDGMNRIQSTLYGGKKLNHKYLLSCQIKPSKDIYFTLVFAYNYANNTDMKLASSGVWNNISGIITSEEDSDRSRKWILPQGSLSEGDSYIAKNFMLFDLTQMFGAGNEPSTVEVFEAMFPDDYYEYCEPTIISSQTDRVEVASADGTITQQITTGFPVLNSAGSVYDYIDLNEGKLHQRVGVVDLGTLSWRYSEPDGWHQVVFKNRGRNNLLCDRYKTDKYALLNDKTIGCNSSYLVVVDTSYTDGNALKQALQGVMLYYGLAEEVIADITIPTELSDWLTVEAGGSITFHNADESKQLAVPNAVSWVRKLNEVE